MNYAIAPALDLYRRTLAAAREAGDTVIIETYGIEGARCFIMQPGNMVVEPTIPALRMFDENNRLVDILLEDSPILPSVTPSTLHDLKIKIRGIVADMGEVSSRIRLTFDGEQSVISPSEILVDTCGIWFPDGTGVSWQDHTWWSYSEGGRTGSNPLLTIARKDGRRIILRA